MKNARCVQTLLSIALIASVGYAESSVDELLQQINMNRGIVGIVGLPEGGADRVVELAKSNELTIFIQSDNLNQISAIRTAAKEANLLGDRIFVDVGPSHIIQLADNIADSLLVSEELETKPTDAEILRAMRPNAVGYVGSRKLIKPVPDGIDDWSHPYHGPDNNPQSTDRLVQGEFRTQFLGFPKFSPMPQQTVIAGGRIFKAMGHIAHKANQNEMLNTLLCINAYNGTILWKRANSPGFMIHRNTMIATEDALYVGDHESCKIIDAATGEVRDEIVIDKNITDGPVWKWMAIKNGILYALVGNPEVKVDTQKSARRGLGHWPWGMWEGHDYNDPRTAFGFGRTIVAIDLKTKELLWNYRDEEFLDARGICMNDSKIFCCSAERFLACIDIKNGKLLWKNTNKDLLEAIGPNEKAQHYVTGYATTCYIKCNNDQVLLAGPQRSKLVSASAEDGYLMWSYPVGNLQLVLRDDALWAAGPQVLKNGLRFDYKTGEVLAKFPSRRACTRATGCADSIFFRAQGGTVRVFTETNVAQHIDPMRPPCQDGVLISNGHLYWGPWMCGCELSLYGNIGLSATYSDRNLITDALEADENLASSTSLPIRDNDWPSYRGDIARRNETNVTLPENVKLKWTTQIANKILVTAPVAAGGMVFVADRTGAVTAVDEDGNISWQSHTGGPIYYPPAIAHDRVYVGSADGRVYAFDANSGRQLWRYRVAPEDSRIPVYEALISRWPVSGGIVVKDETVYAAAGIAHYDKTYVVGLDAISGELKLKNDSSGTVTPEVNNGISLQGSLRIVDDELQFLAGGVYETARYDIKTLECKNEPKQQVVSQFRTAFYPFYPSYGKYVSLDHELADGSSLVHDASYEGSQFVSLGLRPPLPAGVDKPYEEAARWIKRRGGVPPKTIWTDTRDRRFTSFAVSEDLLLVAGHAKDDESNCFLGVINYRDGSDGWMKEIPSLVVKGGTAIDHDGRIYVVLENGQLQCFQDAGRG